MKSGLILRLVEPLFYRGRRITASDVVFTIIWHVFFLVNNIYIYAAVLQY